MTAQNGHWAKIAADGAIFLSRRSRETPERTREIHELLRIYFAKRASRIRRERVREISYGRGAAAVVCIESQSTPMPLAITRPFTFPPAKALQYHLAASTRS
jgi:hypothetical protein